MHTGVAVLAEVFARMMFPSERYGLFLILGLHDLENAYTNAILSENNEILLCSRQLEVLLASARLSEPAHAALQITLDLGTEASLRTVSMRQKNQQRIRRRLPELSLRWHHYLGSSSPSIGRVSSDDRC